VHGLKRSLLSQPVLQKRMTAVEASKFEGSFTFWILVVSAVELASHQPFLGFRSLLLIAAGRETNAMTLLGDAEALVRW